MGMDLSELIAKMEGSRERECPLKGQDAIDALNAAADNWMNEHTFRFGELIVQKDGISLGERGGARGENPAIFLQYQEGLSDMFEKAELGTQYNFAALDCVVGWLNAEGGMVVSATCSQGYEPYVAGESA